jgi:hypothetical protein
MFLISLQHSHKGDNNCFFRKKYIRQQFFYRSIVDFQYCELNREQFDRKVLSQNESDVRYQ